MEYWNNIDLHQHTNHDIDCKGTIIKNNYTHKDYYDWLKVQGVKLKAVTCHNNINIVEHIKPNKKRIITIRKYCFLEV